MNKSEAKFHNTAVKMDDALVALLEHKKFNDISIMEYAKRRASTAPLSMRTMRTYTTS